MRKEAPDGPVDWIIPFAILHATLTWIRDGCPMDSSDTPRDGLLDLVRGTYCRQRNFTRSQMIPIKELSPSYELFEEIFTNSQDGEFLKTQKGIFNLLHYHGTGQNENTADYARKEPRLCNNEEDVIRKYRDIYKHNRPNTWATDIEDYPTWKQLRKAVPGDIKMVQFEDTAIYGQPSKLYAYRPKNKYKSPEPLNVRVAEWFKVGLGNEYVDMVKGDTTPSWSSMYKLVEKHKPKGLSSGIGLLQLTNSMASLGICKYATADEIDLILSTGTDIERRGAIRGLSSLGFDPTPRTSKRVTGMKSPFMIFFDTISKCITEEDKAKLFWTPSNAEHVLCKIIRYRYCLSSKNSKKSSNELDSEEGQTILSELALAWMAKHKADATLLLWSAKLQESERISLIE